MVNRVTLKKFEIFYKVCNTVNRIGAAFYVLWEQEMTGIKEGLLLYLGRPRWEKIVRQFRAFLVGKRKMDYRDYLLIFL